MKALHSSLLLLVLGSFSLAAHADDVKKPPPIDAVLGVAITVSDLDRAVEFYTKVLPFEIEAIEERSGEAIEHLVGVFGARMRVAKLRLGKEVVELDDYIAAEGRPFPPESKGNDLWFQHIAIVVSDMQKAYAILEAHHVVHASTAPQRLPDWNQNAAGIEAYYFRDPDSHWLELIHFPSGKGDPRWQKETDAVFLGIDHTAIVVDDTEKALAFWRDQLGLRVLGGSENYGVEQEHLNGVFNAHLKITTLHARAGIGVELLDYLSPADGLRTPLDVRASDLQHWWTMLETESPEAIVEVTRANSPRWVSPGVVTLEAGGSKSPRSAIALRDPDGHGVLAESVR